jgi:hypothetical protein
MNAYDKGDVVRLSAAFTTASVAVDPTTVSLVYQKPRTSQVTLTYAGGGVTKDSTGNYHVDLTTDVAGTWVYRWVSTGTGAAAETGRFVVRSNPLDLNDP